MNAAQSYRFRLIVAALALTVCLAAAGQARAETNVVQKTLQSTGFVVINKGKNELGYGTCWIVDQKQKLVVTNAHVVSKFTKCQVAFPRMTNGAAVTSSAKYATKDYISGKVLAVDQKRDLALIQLEKLPAGTKAMVLAPESAPAGAQILAIGNCGMAGKNLNEGSLWRTRKGTVKGGMFKITTLKNTDQKLETRVIQTDSGSKPGDSGGPVVDDQGRLVGVNSCNDDKGDYAVDVNELKVFLARAIPAKNLAPPTSRPVGTYTLSWKYKGTDSFAGLVLNADGTGNFDGAKLCPGTYTFEDGKLTLKMPGSCIDIPVTVTWINNNVFRFTVQYTDMAIEYTATRR